MTSRDNDSSGPFDGFDDFLDELAELFEEMPAPETAPTPPKSTTQADMTPHSHPHHGREQATVDTRITNDEYNIIIDMPRFKPENVSLHRRGNILVIKASEIVRDQSLDPHQKSFTESLQLPGDAVLDSDEVEASYRNGVFEIRVPRSELPSEEIDFET